MSTSSSPIARFFGGIWTVVVTLYKVLIVISLAIFAFSLWLIWSGPPRMKIESDIALIVAPTGQLVDQVEIDPARAFLNQLEGAPPPQTAVADVATAFEKGATDDRIRFAVLKLDGLWGAGQAQLNEVIAAMQVFRDSGKKVVAYSAWYDQASYLAASHADEIVMDPMGMVAIEGLASYTLFFKGLTDKLGVEMNVFRVGEYKSAVEPFTRTSMSEESKAANREWLSDLWQRYTETVAAGRDIDATAVVSYVERMPERLKREQGDWASLATSDGLVTHVETLRAFRTRMGEIVGFDDAHGSFRQIHFQNYVSARQRELASSRKKKVETASVIARVVVQGEIVDGSGDIGYAGGDTLSELIDDARRDDRVRGVLLRVNSPGGSVWASEQIRRAVEHLRDDGKPVVVSMGNVAASGGYWVSMNADRIYAHPETITGSIGIFGLIPTFDQALGKIGITTDGVGTTSLAGAFRLDRPLSPAARSLIQSEIERGYREFIDRVAAARGQSPEAIDLVARGRVWSGEAALGHGLVDMLGSEAEATEALAVLAGLDNWVVEDFSPMIDPIQRFISQFTGGLVRWVGTAAVPRWMASWLRPAISELDALARWNDPRGRYAHCQCGVLLGTRAAP